jgi:hypothetical protein
MRRQCVIVLVALAALLSACGAARGSASLTPESVAGSPSTSPPQRIPLPGGFPVVPGAVQVAMPNDDPGLIGLWTTDLPGSGAYDFFVNALPAAGYRIVAAYPGGGAAVIRFSLPDGAIWQVVTRAGPDGSVAIEVRLDRR